MPISGLFPESYFSRPGISSRMGGSRKRIRWALPTAMQETIRQLQRHGQHYVPEIQPDTRLTPALLHHLWALVQTYNIKIVKRAGFVRRFYHRKPNIELPFGVVGGLASSNNWGTCCASFKSTPFLPELLPYLEAVDAVDKQPILPRNSGFSWVQRGTLQAAVRQYKRRLSPSSSYAFSCPNCSASRPVLLGRDVKRFLSLIVWYIALAALLEAVRDYSQSYLETTYNVVYHAIPGRRRGRENLIAEGAGEMSEWDYDLSWAFMQYVGGGLADCGDKVEMIVHRREDAAYYIIPQLDEEVAYPFSGGNSYTELVDLILGIGYASPEEQTRAWHEILDGLFLQPFHTRILEWASPLKLLMTSSAYYRDGLHEFSSRRDSARSERIDYGEVGTNETHSIPF